MSRHNPEIKSVFSHPRDAEIRELYLGGLGFKGVAERLGIGRSIVEYSLHRQGIMRAPPKNTSSGREQEILALAKLGYGFKTIRAKLGISGNAVAIKVLMKKHGLKATGIGSREWNRQNNTVLWGTADIDEQLKAEHAYERAIRKAYAKTREEKNAEALANYYANHEENKAKCKANALKRYHSIKHSPWWKAKQFARNQAYRVVEQVRGLRCGWGHREYLGCTYEHAAAHIKAQLPDGWSWDNYGIEWEIDHIRPLSDHNLMDDLELRMACHYTNLRPLSIDENRRRKRGRYSHRQAA